MTKPRLQIRDRNGGLNAVRRQFLDLDDRAVKVGVLEGAGRYKANPTKAQRRDTNRGVAAVRKKATISAIGTPPADIGLQEAFRSLASAIETGKIAGREERKKRKAVFAEQAPTIAQVAHWNEFGTKRAPSRPAFRTAFRARGKDAIGKVISNVTSKVVQRKMMPAEAIQRIGVAGQALLRQRIVELDAPANAPSTAQAKGSSNPLVASGTLVRSITYVVVRGNEARTAKRGAASGRGLTAPVRGAA